MQGFCFEGPPRRPGEDPMPTISQLGANWVSLTPFAFMPSDSRPELRVVTSGGWWGESDEGIIESAQWARAAGLRVMLKPHIWLHGRGEQWRGTIEMTSEGDWEAWFAAYERWILHYADLAEREGMEALVVGTELVRASIDPRREQSWRRVIASVREHYSGTLLWSAHWESEFERLPFWDALDAIGVGIYFPLSQRPSAPDEEIRAVWRSAAERIGRTAERLQRPVIFTEVGYRSSADAAIAPWLWRSEAALDLDLQRRLYEAMFEACWDQPWFGGLFIWKWRARPGAGGPDDRSFTPQGKPVLGVIAHWFRDGR
jgi:hypothetical protein